MNMSISNETKKGRIQSLAGGTKTRINVLTLNFSISYTIQFGNTKLYKTHRNSPPIEKKMAFLFKSILSTYPVSI